jgi:hypothetical protein
MLGAAAVLTHPLTEGRLASADGDGRTLGAAAALKPQATQQQQLQEEDQASSSSSSGRKLGHAQRLSLVEMGRMAQQTPDAPIAPPPDSRKGERMLTYADVC